MPPGLFHITGTILNERYRVVRLLDQDGQGAVYRAFDLNLQKPIAIKESYDLSTEAVAKFKREAVMLASLRHINLPLVTDHFYIPGEGHCLVMDFIDGRDLQEWMSQVGRPQLTEQILPVIAQICDALSYLHNQSPLIVHRNVKPSNVKINKQGEVSLVGFGVGTAYQKAVSQAAGGLPPACFAAPEQNGQNNPDARSDNYSLGATLFMVLTGSPPPDGLSRRMMTPLRSPRSLNPAIPPLIEAAILKAMDLSPAQRFQSAAEMKSALGIPQGSAAVYAAPTAPTVVYSQAGGPTISVAPVGDFSHANLSNPGSTPAPGLLAQPAYPQSASQPEFAQSGKMGNSGWRWVAILLVIGVIALCLLATGAGAWFYFSLPSSPTPTATLHNQSSPTTIRITPTETQELVLPPIVSPTTVPVSTPGPFPTTTWTAMPTLSLTATRRFPSQTPTLQGTWQPCANIYPSRLHVGDRAYVSYDPPKNNNVRRQPNINAKLIGVIQPGEEVEILAGPNCGNDMVWWQVRSLSTGLTGWTSEGDGDRYWLVPFK